MAITTLPTPPSRQDPNNFALRADAFLGALPTFATEANALASELNGYSTAASASATSAANSATSAANSATGAANSASSAVNSASNAADSATSAANSATSAANSATSAASSLLAFDDRYLGARSSAPSTQSDGTPLVAGSLYWNTSNNTLNIWTGSAWQQAAASITGAVLSVNGRQGAVVISKADIESAFPFSSSSVANNGVVRDASGNFAGNIISAVDFNSTSDARLKEQVVSLTAAPDNFEKLNPVSFTWKDSGKQSYGLIAQEVEQLFPELVVEREDGTKGVNYIPLIAMLLAKVQQLSAKIDQCISK